MTICWHRLKCIMISLMFCLYRFCRSLEAYLTQQEKLLKDFPNNMRGSKVVLKSKIQVCVEIALNEVTLLTKWSNKPAFYNILPWLIYPTCLRVQYIIWLLHFRASIFKASLSLTMQSCIISAPKGLQMHLSMTVICERSK